MIKFTLVYADTYGTDENAWWISALTVPYLVPLEILLPFDSKSLIIVHWEQFLNRLSTHLMVITSAALAYLWEYYMEYCQKL